VIAGTMIDVPLCDDLILARITMLQKKTLQQREKELQAYLATPTGRKELLDLASRYATISGRLRPAGKSAITYILVYEREQGQFTS
jgi:hypothetical protein